MTIYRVEVPSNVEETKVNNDFVFLSGVPFPKNYLPTVKKILTRLFRVFVHVYIHHFDKLVAIGAVSTILMLT